MKIEPDLNNKGCLDKWRLFFIILHYKIIYQTFLFSIYIFGLFWCCLDICIQITSERVSDSDIRMTPGRFMTN